MTVALAVSLIWLLAMVAAAIHLRDGQAGLRDAIGALLAFALVTAVATLLSPQPNWVGVLVGLGAFWRLIAGPLPKVGPLLSGASAGLAAALPIGGGLPAWLAIALTGAALLAAMILRRNTGQNAGRELEIILVAVALGAPLLGLGGDLVFGWTSAVMLKRDAVVSIAPAPPGWTLVIVGLALVAGALRGIWKKR